MINTTNMGIMANYMQPSSSTMASNMISKKDNDSDSSLSIDEMGVSSELFSSYDSNVDGLVSQSELTTAIDTAMSQFNGNMPTKEQFQSILSDFGFNAPNSTNSSGSTSNTLSSSQQETISTVLQNYDANNLTKSDAQDIVAAFKDAGIEPSTELESAMKDAGFDAQEVGTLAGVGAAQSGAVAQGGGTPPAGGGGGGGGGSSSSSSSSTEDYDVMDTNQDGIVSAEEMAAYYATDSSSTSTDTLSQNQQNTTDNLQLLMSLLKSNSGNDSVSTDSFNGILKAINIQNNNSQINSYLQNSNTSSVFDYA